MSVILKRNPQPDNYLHLTASLTLLFCHVIVILRWFVSISYCI